MISIVIPTCKEKNLIPCLESIHKYTDLSDVEINVVANGYDGERQKDWIWFPEQIGFPNAVNSGIKSSHGRFVVILNDDVVLTEQPVNQWLDILLAPFSDPKVAMTGPWKMFNTEIEREFICFFCAMIRKSVLDDIGLLDPVFSPGYSEDVDLSCKAVDAGYKIVQVPSEEKLPYDGQFGYGRMPMYHHGNQTFKNWPGGPELFARNHAILRERYGGVIIANAQKLGEWMSDDELRWLSRQAKKSQVAIELGSWFGKSATVLADNLPQDGILYCIDTWAGSQAEKDTNHIQARDMNGDFAYDQFVRNLWPHIASGKLRTIRMHGRHAAKLLKDMGVKADMVFIDAGHLYEETKADILTFQPLLKEGGTLCGHDYWQSIWPGVTQAVDEIFGVSTCGIQDSTIWATTINPKPCVFDCFTFNNEFDILEQRLKTMWDVTDRFIIVEATVTHAGKPKTLQFHNNLQRFEKWLSKITYLVVEDSPKMNGSEDSAWNIERHQRNAIMRGLKDCKDSDVIIVSDVDEIPNPEAIKSFQGEDIASLEMELYVYDYTVKAREPWYHAKVLTYKKLKELTPCGARYAHESYPLSYPALPILKNGGQHLSYFGGIESIQRKIESTAHRNIDIPKFKDPAHIKRCMEQGLDLFERDIQYEKVAVHKIFL